MKEPKEKAKQLFNDYYLLAESIECKVNDDLLNQFEDINELIEVKNYWHDLAKQSALMAVDLMLYHTEEDGSNIPLHNYYKEVESDLEKL